MTDYRDAKAAADKHRRVIERDPTLDPNMPAAMVVMHHVTRAVEAEKTATAKWGDLYEMSSTLLQAKIDAQREKLERAIRSKSEAEVRKHAEAMIRGWKYLDKVAAETGQRTLDEQQKLDAEPKPPEIDWEKGDEIPF